MHSIRQNNKYDFDWFCTWVKNWSNKPVAIFMSELAYYEWKDYYPEWTEFIIADEGNRYLPNALVKAGIFASNSDVKRVRPDLMVKFNGDELYTLYELKIGKTYQTKFVDVIVMYRKKNNYGL